MNRTGRGASLAGHRVSPRAGGRWCRHKMDAGGTNNCSYQDGRR